VCSAPKLIKVAPSGGEMGVLRGSVPEYGTECSLCGPEPGMWEEVRAGRGARMMGRPPRRGTGSDDSLHERCQRNQLQAQVSATVSVIGQFF
jgi:hypothetical protein